MNSTIPLTWGDYEASYSKYYTRTSRCAEFCAILNILQYEYISCFIYLNLCKQFLLTIMFVFLSPAEIWPRETFTVYAFTKTKLKELDICADECIRFFNTSTFRIAIREITITMMTDFRSKSTRWIDIQISKTLHKVPHLSKCKHFWNLHDLKTLQCTLFWSRWVA